MAKRKGTDAASNDHEQDGDSSDEVCY